MKKDSLITILTLLTFVVPTQCLGSGYSVPRDLITQADSDDSNTTFSEGISRHYDKMTIPQRKNYIESGIRVLTESLNDILLQLQQKERICYSSTNLTLSSKIQSLEGDIKARGLEGFGDTFFIATVSSDGFKRDDTFRQMSKLCRIIMCDDSTAVFAENLMSFQKSVENLPLLPDQMDEDNSVWYQLFYTRDSLLRDHSVCLFINDTFALIINTEKNKEKTFEAILAELKMQLEKK